MFSTAIWTLFLLSSALPEGRTVGDDDLVYCDDEYRSKYIVAKTLTDMPGNVSGSTNQLQESEQSTEISAGQDAGAHKNGGSSEEAAVEETDCHPAQQTSRRPEATTVAGVRKSKTPKKFRSLSLTFKAVIDLELDSREEPQQARRKRQVDDAEEWEGETTCRLGRRLIGGSLARDIEELPYIVLVDSGCGGSVIAPSWVLTAAHCIPASGPIYVYAGSLRLRGGCRHLVERATRHPGYSNESFANDIALLRLRRPLVLSPAIRTIALSSAPARPGDCGSVAGWGTEQVNGTMVHELMRSVLPVVHRRRCGMFALGDGQFCAGFRDAQTDTCQGDSGGPFVVNGSLVGIVSYGYLCAVRETPGVYTEVAHHRRWIESVSGV